MKCILARCAGLLVCILFAPLDAGAAARGPTARESAAMKATRAATAKPGTGQQDLESWFARLQGTFSVKYDVGEKTNCRVLNPDGVTGPQLCTTQKAAAYFSHADCRALDEGVGLRCVFDGLRPDTPENRAAAAAAAPPAMFLLDPLPARALFDIDPSSGKASVTTTNAAGVAFGATGSLQGDDITFKGKCDSADGRRRTTPCTWSLWVHAPSDGRRILITRTMRTDSHSFELIRVEQ